MIQNVIEIYTDGSCLNKYNFGGWAAIILFNKNKILLKGNEKDTTHNRMELLAVIKSIEYVNKNYKTNFLKIYTDSQYVFRIPERMEKLIKNNFITKKGNLLHNNDLIEILIRQIETNNIEFVKVKAHQKENIFDNSIMFNLEVDKIARQMIRDRG